MTAFTSPPRDPQAPVDCYAMERPLAAEIDGLADSVAPIDVACWLGFPDVVDLLITARANIGEVTDAGDSCVASRTTIVQARLAAVTQRLHGGYTAVTRITLTLTPTLTLTLTLTLTPPPHSFREKVTVIQAQLVARDKAKACTLDPRDSKFLVRRVTVA